jgi:glutamyl-tRNA reductase
MTKEMLQQALVHRRTRPLFLLDIAVPRDIEPAAGDLQNVYLYDIDDLHSIVDSNLAERQRESLKVESMIASEMELFEEWKRTIRVAPVIQALQITAQTIHEETMSSLLQKLPELDEREIRVIRKLTKSITNQLLRDPILRIKEMSAGRGGNEALEYFTQIFALEDLVEEEGQTTAEQPQAREPEPKPASLALQ